MISPVAPAGGKEGEVSGMDVPFLGILVNSAKTFGVDPGLHPPIDLRRVEASNPTWERIEAKDPHKQVGSIMARTGDEIRKAP